MPTTPRRTLPQIFVAYGELGHLWLSDVRARCRTDETLEAMIEAQVVQLWCFGIDGKNLNGISTWQTIPTVGELSKRFDAARLATSVTRFPGLGVTSVRILERISLFEADAVQLRPALKARLDELPGRAGPGSSGEHGFQVQWIALADSIHDPTALDKHGRKNALNLLEAAGENALTLLVDREDEHLAVQDTTIASSCLLELAMAYAQSDIGAPRNDGVSVQPPAVTQRSQPRTIVPFSVAVLEHSRHRIDEARSRALKEALAGGMRDVGARLDAFGTKPPLQDILRDERNALDGNRYDRFERYQPRFDAATETIAFMIASGDMRWMRSYLVEIRREAAALEADADASPARHPPAVAMLAAAQLPEMEPAAIQVAVLVLVLVVAVVALILIRRARRRAEAALSTSAFDEQRTTPRLRNEVRKEWEDLCDDLANVFDAWEQQQRRIEQSNHAAGVDTRAWEPSPPIGQRMTDTFAATATTGSVSPELCLSVARHTFEAVRSGTTPAAALDQACQRVLRERDRNANRHQPVVSGLLETALSEPYANAIEGFVRQRPYLAKTRRPLERDSIVWLSTSTASIEDRLTQQEQAAAQSVVQVLSHDDSERTVRFAFAKCVAWEDVSSLSLDRSNV